MKNCFQRWNGDESMYEKISDEIVRREKIRKLKEKIMSEIEKEIRNCKKELQSNIQDKDFDYCIRDSFALLELKRYIENDNCFMRYEAKYNDKDIVIYMVSDKDLDIWLQKDYSFVENYLLKEEEAGYNIFPILNDKYFGYNFTNIFDSILYDKKQRKITT